MATKFRPTTVSLATAYADQSEGTGDEFVIPEDFATLGDADLTELHDRAMEHFDALYGDGNGLSDEDVAALSALTEGIESLAGEVETRNAAAAERDASAAELAARIRPAAEEETLSAETDEADPEVDGEVDEADEADEDVEETEGEEEGAAEVVTASARRGAIRVPLSNVRNRARTHRPPAAEVTDETPQSIEDVMTASGEGLGMSVGTSLTFGKAGGALNTRLKKFNASQYESAARAGRHIREQAPLLQINRPIPRDLQILSNDPDHVREVMERATSERNLPGGSLVASGTGWCAPSTPVYELFNEEESRDGLLDVAEVGVPRGGLSLTPGPDFRTLFEEVTGFSFTEDQDIAGEYAPGETAGDPNVEGPKPCFKVDCPDFEDYRLDVDGLCITAGILQQRGFPEVLARTIRGALVAHDHRVNAKLIAQMVAGSDAVTMPSQQAGAAAPLLTAIELQVEHYRYVRRMSRSTTLEAVFPYWVHGAIRSDLSRRLGVDLLSVSDAQINGWFSERGIRPQFVYNWQDISGDASAFTEWPDTVSFLLYSAGTWLRGVNDVITMDTIYDSVLLGTNDFTALFTEEGWFLAKRGHDSRVVTTSIATDGATHQGIDIAHDGTVVTGG